MRLFLRVSMAVIGLYATFFNAAGAAQSTGAIEGRVLLPAGERAHRATVLVEELGVVAETDELGQFRFDSVPPGVYNLRALQSFLDSETHPVEVRPGETAALDIRLRISVVRQRITVTARGREESTFDAVQSVVSLDSFDLAEAMAPSLGDVLDGQLGVAKRSFGAGSGRPVVRGFDGDRVLIMQDGLPVGSLGSQSGDHGEPIDAGSLERIEVVKGPATLLYGSNAVGGVVNAISSHQEFHQQPHAGLTGHVSSTAGTANAQAGGSFSLNYGAGPWLFWAGGGGQRTGDYATPAGRIENSRTRISHGVFGFGWFGERVFASLGYRGADGRYGVPFADVLHAHEDEDHDGHEHEEEEEGHEEEPGEEDHDHEEEHDHEELDAVDIAYRQHNLRFTGGVRGLGPFLESFQVTLTHSDWNHDEVEIFPDGIQETGTTFENQQFIYRGVFTQRARGPLAGTFGFSGLVRDYDARGEEALSPPVDQSNVAVFALEEIGGERFKLQFGGRAERNAYTPRSESALPGLSFTGVSAAAGVRVGLWAGGAFVANYTDSFRAPALEELYNFGPHPGNLTFEIGNPELGRERARGTDLALRHQADRMRAEANFFYYNVADFVFLAPTGAVEHGLMEAAYTQGNARFLGTEIQADLGLHPNLWLKLGLDAVDAQLAAGQVSLPRIPPMRGTIGVDIRHGGLSIQPELVLADRREDIFPTETPTAGYGRLGLRASYTIPRQHFSHHFGFEWFNLGDKLYRNHLSFIKDLAPEIGRGARVSYSVRFF